MSSLFSLPSVSALSSIAPPPPPSLPSLSSSHPSPLHPPPTPSPPTLPSSPSPARSATVKQRGRRPSSTTPFPSLNPPPSPLAPPPPPPDLPPLPPKLSLAELEAESKAHHHRLALDRPAFVEKRRAEEGSKREERRSRVRRWPYIDARNIERFTEEQERERKEREEQKQLQLEQEKAEQQVQQEEDPNATVLQQSGEETKDAGDAHVGDESKEAAAADPSASPPGHSPGPAGDGEDTEDEEGGPPLTADSDSVPNTHSRSRKKKAAVWWQKKGSKKRRTTSSSPSPPSTHPPLSLSAPPFPAPVHHAFGHFSPTLMLGNRVHFFDLLTSLPRDGDLISYSPSRRAFLVRLDPTVSEVERSLKESALQRWLKVEEQEVWEYIDVAWCRHPDRGGIKSWWPCDVVRVYREGRIVPPHLLHTTLHNPDDTEDEDDGDGGQVDHRHRPVLVVHLLGLAEDTRLFALESDAVMTWSEGLSMGLHTRPTKAIAQALKDGDWTHRFHLQKWVNLEHQRRLRAADAVRSRAGEAWIGRSVSVLWDEDDRWYAGRVLQYNAVLNSLCVLYNDAAVEWVNLTGDFAVTDDATDLPFVLQPGSEPEQVVQDCYRSYHLYDDIERSLDEWEQLIQPPRATAGEVRAALVVQDPTLDEVSSACWECGLVDDVYLLASNMGMRAGMKKEEKKENVRCLRCSKTCHSRCFHLMCDHLQRPQAEQQREENKRGDSGRTASGQLRGGWSVMVDRKKPRCIDCLRCEHCGGFGAKELRPSAEEDSEGKEPVLTTLRSPSDFLVCDVCDLRAHRQCVEPAIPDDVSMDGGFICRTCLQCRSCGDTQVQMEQPGYTRKPGEDEPAYATHQLDDGDEEGGEAIAGGGEKAQKKAARKRADRVYHAKRKKRGWKGKNSKGPSHRRGAAALASHLAAATSAAAAGSAPTAGNSSSGADVAPLPTSESPVELRPHSVGEEAMSAEHAGEQGGPAAAGASSSSSTATAAPADASHAAVQMEVEAKAAANEENSTAVDISELQLLAGPAAEPSTHHGQPETESTSRSPIPAVAGEGDVETDAAEMEDEEEDVADVGEADVAVSSTAVPVKKRGRPRKKEHARATPSPALTPSTTAAVVDVQAQPSVEGEGEEGVEDAADDAVVLRSASPSFVALPFAWSQWSYACSMCVWCSERMRRREYCPICCSIWDASAMIECNRCRRWVHIECDPSAVSFGEERLSRSTVLYHCPDCVKREQANEMMLIMDALKAADRHSYFLHPVTEEMAPEYFQTIKTPMDFSTITHRLHALSYTELEQFKYDLNLVWRNAKDYNPQQSAIHKHAVRLQSKSMELLEQMMRKKGDQGLERKEGRIEDWEELRVEEEKLEQEEREDKERENNSAAAKHAQKRGDEEQKALVTAAPLVPINPHQRLRGDLLALPLDVLCTFYSPQLSVLLSVLDACLVCGSMGDSEHLLACSDCGEVVHWFCIDSQMLNRISAADSRGGWKVIKPEMASTDLTVFGHASCINVERLAGYKCPNCALCPVCHLNGELWGTRGVKRRRGGRGGDDGEEEHEELVSEQQDVSQLMIACDLCDRPYHVHCLRSPLPEAALSSASPPAFRCPRCVSCHFCGARKPGKSADARWMFDYTACQTCGTMWEEGLYCPVCEMVWSKKGGRATMGHDGLLCERCDKWTHVTCDSISPQQLSVLRRPDFHYHCPSCRTADADVTARWTEQLRDIELVIDDRQRRDEEKKQRALLSQDFLTRLFPPFDLSCQPWVGALGQSRSVLTSAFAFHLQPHCVQHLHGLSLLEQVELLKNEVRRVQLKRRRDRRAALLQQKRRRLKTEYRGRVWLMADEDVDGDIRSPADVLEQQKEQLQAVLQLCFPVLPFSNRVQHVPLLLQPVAIRPPRAASAEPQHVHPAVPVPLEMPPLDAGRPLDASVLADEVGGVNHVEPLPALLPTPVQALAVQVKVEHSQHVVPGGRPKSRARGLALPSAVLTFASLHSSSASSSVHDPRSCCFCHVSGDLTSPTSAGRLLPAHPFHPLLSFAHVQCALWSCASYGGVNDAGQLSGVFSALSRCFHVHCSTCQQPGAAIPCRYLKCRRVFHFHCAVASSCAFTSDMRLYCAEHADRAKRSSLHSVGPIHRRLTIRLPRLEFKDGRITGTAKAMEIREAEMVADGSGKASRRANKRKSTTAKGGWKKRKSIKDEDRVQPRDKEEKREEGDADEEDEEGDEDEGDKAPLASVHGDSGRLLDGAFAGSEPSRSPSPSTEHQPLVKQEDERVKEEDTVMMVPSPIPSEPLPLSTFHQRLGALTIHSLGTVPTLPTFHSSHFLYPDGYSATRIFHSYRGPPARTVYHVLITADAVSHRPQFHIQPSDDSANPIRSESPALAFHLLLSRFKPPLDVHASSATMSGAYFFGFGLPAVLEQLEGQEGLEGLAEYERLSGGRAKGDDSDMEEDVERSREKEREEREAEELQRAMQTVVPVNPTGSARTEGWQGKSTAARKSSTHKANFSSSITSTSSSSSSSSAPSPPPSSSIPFTESTGDKRRKALVDYSAHVPLAQQYRSMKASPTRARVGHSPIHEWGLYASEALDAGVMVIEYLGETIRQKVADVREQRYEEVGIGSCYMFRIDDDLIVDATKKGNIGRFINHSCDPCCVTKIIEYGGEKKIVVITTRRVEVGEEITYDYFFANEQDRIACNCGARNCAGRLN